MDSSHTFDVFVERELEGLIDMDVLDMTLCYMDDEPFDHAKDLEDLERLLVGDREERP